MPAQVKIVKHARQDQGKCSSCGTPLPVGSTYRYYKPGFRSRVKVRRCMKPECTPKRSELDTSKMSDAYAAVEEAEAAVEAAATVDAVQSALDDCSSAISDVSGAYEDSISETPMLEEQLRPKVEMLEDFASTLDSVSLDDPPEPPDEPQRSDYEGGDDGEEAFSTDHDTYEDELETWKEEVEQALDEAKEAARDALSELE